MQLARLQAVDLRGAEVHHKLVIRQWRSELRAVLGTRRVAWPVDAVLVRALQQIKAEARRTH